MGTDGDLMMMTGDLIKRWGCSGGDRWRSNGGNRQGDLIIGTELAI
jgi:hypothetical protein